MPKEYPFNVFVSYASQDRAFARTLVGWLRLAGRDVWFDIERIPAGASVQETLTASLKVSRHVILLITENWLASDWTKWEGGSFRRRQKGEEEGRLVPIVKVPFQDERLPYYLEGKTFLEWLPDDRNVYSWFYRLDCALEGWAPDQEDLWEKKGRDLLKGGRPALAPETPAEHRIWTSLALRQGPSDDLLHVLSCDRDSQWGRVNKPEAARLHEAFLVQGGAGEDHDLFLDRVQQCLPSSQPPRQVVPVRWDSGIPSNNERFLEELAEAFDVPRNELPGTLGKCLGQSSLILLHRPVCEEEFEENERALLSYYTRCLPDLITEIEKFKDASPRWGLKVVQSVAWPPSNPLLLAAAMLARFGIRPEWARDGRERIRARSMLLTIQKDANWSVLPVYLLEELRLRQIDDDHLRELAIKLRHRIKDPEGFPRRVRRRARDSATLFKRIFKEVGIGRERNYVDERQART